MDLEERTVKWYDVRHWFNVLTGRSRTATATSASSSVQDEAREILKEYPDLRVSVQDVSAFQAAGFRQSMIDFNLRGPDLEKLAALFRPDHGLDEARPAEAGPSPSSGCEAAGLERRPNCWQIVRRPSQGESVRFYCDVRGRQLLPRRRHQPHAPQAGAPRDPRPQAGLRPGHPHPDHRLDAQRPGGRRAGLEVQGIRRAVRRLAPRRPAPTATRPRASRG